MKLVKRITLIMTLLSTNWALAYEETIATLKSQYLEETREAIIELPDDYHDGKENSYPVLYLLDGNAHLSHATASSKYLAARGYAPQMIIVAIKNTKRSLNFTPTKDSSKPFPSGGADLFLDFLEFELIPFIDKKYRTKPFKTIAGHSLGGLFAVHALYARPNLFQAHFAFSPSLHWQEAITVEKSIGFLSKEVNFKNFLYLNIGDEGFDDRPNGKEMRNAVTKLSHYLNKKPKNNLQYKIDNLDTETHATTPLIGFVKAYRSLYKEWSLPESTFLTGLSSIEKHYSFLSNQFGYKIYPQERLINFAGYYQLMQNKNIIEAVRLFKYNIENNPNSSNAYESLADAYEKQGKIEEALKQMELAIKLSSKADDNYNQYISHKERLLKL